MQNDTGNMKGKERGEAMTKEKIWEGESTKTQLCLKLK